MVKNLKRIEKTWFPVSSSFRPLQPPRRGGTCCFLKPQEHVQSEFDDQVQGGSGMNWARMLAYITGTVD
jgi:hypothetical protein